MKTLKAIVAGIVGLIVIYLIAQMMGMNLFEQYGFWRPTIYSCLIFYLGGIVRSLPGSRETK